jgi:nicotinamidase-related amidase
MSAISTDKGLLTPENCAVVLIDYQPQAFPGLAEPERQRLVNNVFVLAKAARIFGVPVILTGPMAPALLELFPGQATIQRSSMNAWDSQKFTAAVKETRRKNLIVAALCSEVCLAMPALQALTDGYGIYVVEDASSGASPGAHAATIRRIEQAGGVSVTALQVLLEFQRDWARAAHGDEVRAVMREHGGAYAQGIEYVCPQPGIENDA